MRRGMGERALARIGISGRRPRGLGGVVSPEDRDGLRRPSPDRQCRGECGAVPRSRLGGKCVEPAGTECAFFRPRKGGTTTTPATSHRPETSRPSREDHRPEPRETRRTSERGEGRDGGDQRADTRTEASEARSEGSGPRDAGRRAVVRWGAGRYSSAGVARPRM